jgi:hypothetical protein
MKNRIDTLKNRFITAKSEKEYAAIDLEMKKLIKEDPDKFAVEMVASAKETADKAAREQLQDVLPVLSISNIAKVYFKKTPNWFYQRLNGNKVNGKAVKFTKSELNTLNFALKDISKRVGSISIS